MFCTQPGAAPQPILLCLCCDASADWPLGTPKHVQAAFEPLLHEFGVDLWLCGHKHYYERTRPA